MLDAPISVRARYYSAYANAYANVTPITPRGHRTPDEIREQLEARLAEMEREASSPAMQFPCRDCRWHERDMWSYCKHPLIMGIKARPVSRVNDDEGARTTKLCGPEKALWEPKLPMWQRFVEWFLEPWRS